MRRRRWVRTQGPVLDGGSASPGGSAAGGSCGGGSIAGASPPCRPGQLLEALSFPKPMVGPLPWPAVGGHPLPCLAHVQEHLQSICRGLHRCLTVVWLLRDVLISINQMVCNSHHVTLQTTSAKQHRCMACAC